MKTPVFAGLFDDSSFNDAQEQNALQAKRRAAFNQTWERMKGDEDIPSLEALRKFVYKDNHLDDLQTAELMRVFTGFRGHDSWQDMLDLVEKSTDKTFKNAAIVREFCAVACNMTGQYDRTLEICQALIEDGVENGEVYGAMGKAYLKKDDLRQSANMYEKGFLIAFETYPGINVAYREIEMGNPEKAEKIAQILQLALLRDGVKETNDYWTLAVEVESSAIRGATFKEIDSVMRHLNELPNIEPWMINSSLGALKRVLDFYDDDSRYAASFDYTIKQMERLKNKLDFQSAVDLEKHTQPSEPDVSSALNETSFNYRGLASNFIGQHFVSGNFRFGGQLPDHSLTRSDYQQFEKLLQTPLIDLIHPQKAATLPATIADIKDTQVFLEVADTIVRNAFGTDRDELEDLMSEGHSRYDIAVHALLRVAGCDENLDMRSSSDSRTNISVIMGLGLGDCRHHAQAKQLLFDVWQKQRMNENLRNAYEALKNDDADTFEKAVKEFRGIESEELRTFDMVVRAPIQINGPYSPIKHESGLPLASESSEMSIVEEHTMTMLLRRNQDHVIEQMRFADSFYQHHYQWGDGEISVDDIIVNEKGELEIPAKNITAIDPQSGTEILLPVEITPTAYAGKRDKVSGDEHGALLALGIPVDDDFDLVDELTATQGAENDKITQMRQWYKVEFGIPQILIDRFGPGYNLQ